MEVMSPASKGVQTYIMNRLSVYMYRKFHADEKRGVRPVIHADELAAQFPSLSEAFLRKRLRNCADMQVLCCHIAYRGAMLSISIIIIFPRKAVNNNRFINCLFSN